MKSSTLIVLLMTTLVALASSQEDQQPSAPGPASETTEEEFEEAVFEISQELASEVRTAVETINEVFGAPPCLDDNGGNDAEAEEKRGTNWGYAAAGAAAGYLGKRDGEDGTSQVQKRGWGKYLKAVGKRQAADKRSWIGFGKRSWIGLGKRHPAEKRSWIGLGKRHSAERRSWVGFGKRSWIGLGKRHSEKRSWIGLGKRQPADKRSWIGLGKRSWVGFGKRQDMDLEKRDKWDDFHKARKIATVAKIASSFFGKRSAEEGDVSQTEEAEFRADIAKLSEAVNTLNAVLDVAVLSRELTEE